MTYRVFWSPLAELQLEGILRQRADDPQIVAAARALDSRLARKPLDVGESRYDNVRIGFELPLAVQYEVLEDVRTVIVYDVWWINRKLR